MPASDERKTVPMPNYKDARFLSKNESTDFDKIHKPGETAPHSGIYRCTSCGFEVSSTEGKPLPPTKICTDHGVGWRCNHGEVRWRLVAAAIHKSAAA
jgi:hypothetical protein